jgi:hypothetical protein
MHLANGKGDGLIPYFGWMAHRKKNPKYSRAKIWIKWPYWSTARNLKRHARHGTQQSKNQECNDYIEFLNNNKKC